MYPDTPTFTEALKLTPEQENIRLALVGASAYKAIFATPGIAPDRLAYLHEAFEKIMGMKGFIRQAERAGVMGLNPVGTEKWTAFVERSVSLPKTELLNAMEMTKKYAPATK